MKNGNFNLQQKQLQKKGFIMKRVMIMTAALSLLGAMLTGSEPAITVKRNGALTTMESPFVKGYTLVRSLTTKNRTNPHMNFSNEMLVKGNQKVWIKSSGDDACPWNFNSTYIGANHGDSIASAVIFKTPHGLTEKDCGTALVDDHKRRFYIVKIENPKIFWVLSDNLSKDKDVWRFIRPNAKLTLKSASGKVFKGFDVKFRQLYSPVRLSSRSYLADGKKIAEKGTFQCKVFTVEEEYDIIGTDTILKHVLANKGKQAAFNAPGLEKVLTQKIRYDFYPDNSCIITHDVKFFRDVRLGYMGFIQAYQLNRRGYAKHLYYVPKTLPYTYTAVIGKGKDAKKKVETWDFTKLEDFTRPVYGSIHLTGKHYEDPNTPPERFMQYIKGHKNAPDVGFVTGYSLLNGITVPSIRKKNVGVSLFLYKSHKTYPHAIDGKGIPRIKKGSTFHCVAYRKFFDPGKDFYTIKDGKAHVVYVDFHAPVKGKVIAFPACYGNKKFSVVEKSKTLSFKNSKNTFTFDSTGKYGYCVLKFE